MRDTEIDFMDFEAAREYVLAFITTLKKTQKDRAICEEEMSMWERRVALAESRAEPVLKKAAEERLAELRGRSRRLLEEELDLKRKVDVLKEKLKAAKIRSSLKVDADALLAQMQMLVGEPDSLTEQLRSEEAGQALELLKKRMEEEKNR
jgi:hypothetical protein